MGDSGHVLIVDHDESFARSVCDQLKSRSYQCDTVEAVKPALAMLADGQYDLLIAAADMPGNGNLELIAQLPAGCEGLPSILVDQQPQLDRALAAVQLPVAAYVTRQVDLQELMAAVDAVDKRGRALQAIKEARAKLADWQKDLEENERISSGLAASAAPVTVSAFVTLTFRNVIDSLSDLANLARWQGDGKHVCGLVNCPRVASLLDVLHETIAVLEKTKHAFKSKELGALRKRIEQVVSPQQ